MTLFRPDRKNLRVTSLMLKALKFRTQLSKQSNHFPFSEPRLPPPPPLPPPSMIDVFFLFHAVNGEMSQQAVAAAATKKKGCAAAACRAAGRSP